MVDSSGGLAAQVAAVTVTLEDTSGLALFFPPRDAGTTETLLAFGGRPAHRFFLRAMALLIFAALVLLMPLRFKASYTLGFLMLGPGFFPFGIGA